jgi:Methylamine utilisation protein MauE
VQYVAIGVRCLIGAVFLISSVSKVAGRSAFGAFVGSVRGMRLVSPATARRVAWCVLAGECAVCVLLAVPAPAATRAGFALAAGMLMTFAVAIDRAVRRGVRPSCRCFGPTAVPLGRWQVLRNSVLAGVAVVGAIVGQQVGPVQPGGVLVATCAGLLLGGLVAVLDDLVDLFRPAGAAAMGGGFSRR